MKLLRETIRRLILEDRCGALNPKLQGAIEQLIEHDLTIDYEQFDDRINIRLLRPEAPIVVGELTSLKQPAYMGACNDAFVVGNARVKPQFRDTGIGALMYDVLIELAADDGITSDRVSVSDDAIRIWNYFYRSSDYVKNPLDTANGEYTPDPMDDCEGWSWREHGGSSFSSPTMEEFQSHPLNNTYVKNDKSMATYKCLSDIGRIEER